MLHDLVSRSDEDGTVLKNLIWAAEEEFSKREVDQWLQLPAHDGRGLVDLALASNINLAHNLKRVLNLDALKDPPPRKRSQASGQRRWGAWASDQR